MKEDLCKKFIFNIFKILDEIEKNCPQNNTICTKK